MKKFLLMSACAAGLMMTGCAGKTASAADSTPADTADSNILVAYYSATGTTAKAADEIAKATGGKLYEIEPVEVYTEADLDYENEKSRSAVENQHPEMRPAIKLGLDVTPYDTVYIGFPVWWDKAPLVINTFIDSYDFSGKKIIIFGTAHSSGLTPSFDALKATYPNLDLVEGKILNVTSKDAFNEWVSSLKK